MRKKHRADFIENAQELEVLSEYYPIDQKNKLVTVNVHADNAEELLCRPAAPGLRAPFKTDFFQECEEIISKFPAPYRLNAQIVVEDWGNHTPQELTRSFRDSLEMMQNTKRMKSRRVLFLSAMFVIAGFLILGLMVCGQNLGWFGEGFSASLWEEAVDIAGTVFLWEAVTVVFLEASEESVSDPSIWKRIAFLTFRGTDGALLLRVCDDQLFQHTNKTSRMKRIVRDCLLVSSCGFVIAGINGLMYLPQTEYPVEGAMLTLLRVLLFVLPVSQIVAGVGGFYLFWGKRNGFTAFAKGYAFYALAIIAILMIAGTHSFLEMLSMVLSCCFQLLFIFSLFLDGKISSKQPAPPQQDKAEL